jgi:hypothetical protein
VTTIRATTNATAATANAGAEARSAPRETCSAPFKGSFTSVCRWRNDEPGRQRGGERVSELERGAHRVTNTRDFACTKRVRDRVHDAVHIAGMAGGTKVAMHTVHARRSPHTYGRAQVERSRTLACGHGRASLRSSILRDRSDGSRVRFAAPW